MQINEFIAGLLKDKDLLAAPAPHYHIGALDKVDYEMSQKVINALDSQEQRKLLEIAERMLLAAERDIKDEKQHPQVMKIIREAIVFWKETKKRSGLFLPGVSCRNFPNAIPWTRSFWFRAESAGWRPTALSIFIMWRNCRFLPDRSERRKRRLIACFTKSMSKTGWIWSTVAGKKCCGSISTLFCGLLKQKWTEMASVYDVLLFGLVMLVLLFLTADQCGKCRTKKKTKKAAAKAAQPRKRTGRSFC